MPAQPDRLAAEALLVSEISAQFALARAAMDRDQRIPWPGIAKTIRAELSTRLATAYAVAFLIMGDSRLTNSSLLAQASAEAWATGHARELTRSLTDKMRAEVKSGIDPTKIFGEGRAVTMAATEITAATSRGEMAARQANAIHRENEAEAEREAAEPAGQPGKPPEKPTPDAVEPQDIEEPEPPEPPEVPPPNDDGLAEITDGMSAMWITTRDDRVCPICEPLHKQWEDDWRDTFAYGPPAHPNCRCHLEYFPTEVRNRTRPTP